MEKSKQLDQFYTNEDMAEFFVRKVNEFVDLELFDNVIEPSAGAGAILDCLPKSNRIGLDLDPSPFRKDIQSIDFFDYEFPDGLNACVGNPPFGKNSSLAIDFFNKCAKNSVVVAFIIPRSWLKYKTQSKLDDKFGLYYNVILPEESFNLDGSPYKVRCVGQIWINRNFADRLPNKDVRSQFTSLDDSVEKELMMDLYKYQKTNKCYERS